MNLKFNNVADIVPTTQNLLENELGVNTKDAKAFVNNGAEIVEIGGSDFLASIAATDGQELEVNQKWFLGLDITTGVSLPDGAGLNVGDYVAIIKALPATFLPVVNITGGYTAYFDGEVYETGLFNLNRPIVLYWNGAEWQDEFFTAEDSQNAADGGVDIILTSQNYTIPSEATSVRVTVVGGGGGGASGGAASATTGVGGASGGGGGGGGGAVVEQLIPQNSGNLSLIIGAGGGGGSGLSPDTNSARDGQDGFVGSSSSVEPDGSGVIVRAGGGQAGTKGFASISAPLTDRGGGGLGGTIPTSINPADNVVGGLGGDGGLGGGGSTPSVSGGGGEDIAGNTGGSSVGGGFSGGGGGASQQGNGGNGGGGGSNEDLVVGYGGGGGGTRGDYSNNSSPVDTSTGSRGGNGIIIITWSRV